jgi:threonyl-tRNA synthetase
VVRAARSRDRLVAELVRGQPDEIILTMHQEAVHEPLDHHGVPDQSGRGGSGLSVRDPAMELQGAAADRDHLKAQRTEGGVGVEGTLGGEDELRRRVRAVVADKARAANGARGARSEEFADEESEGRAEGETGRGKPGGGEASGAGGAAAVCSESGHPAKIQGSDGSAYGRHRHAHQPFARPALMTAPLETPIRVTLPDGSVRELTGGTTGAELAASIGAGLARAAIAIKVNGEIRDLARPLHDGDQVAILTERDAESLPILRHSAAHILATAVRNVFPGAGIGFGPSIDEGFYYDFDVPRPFTPEDLEALEKAMAEAIAADYPFVREVVSREEANARFADDPLKLERISELGPDETITIYTDGPFVDLCRGPHVPSTGKLKHFKLLTGAGAYWRGDSSRQMLQRIYGTAYFKKDELAQHLFRLEESKKRDHRTLGKQLDLVMFHPFAPGAAFWTEKGTVIYNALNDYMKALQRDGYREIRTPLLFNKGLWEISGHWGKYKENMFLVLDNESGEHDFSLKPMNCPSHHLLYGSKKHSYRELPIRYVTYDVLHRNEVSGALSGLTRVRQFAQDDCHIYLMERQVQAEVHRLVQFILGYYQTFGLKATLKFATRPEQRIGSDQLWDEAERALRHALEATGQPYELKAGDGAFYGPKIDFDVEDAIGRKWQLGTIQLDYNAAERFDLNFVGEDNADHRPVVIHRAVNGSFERFIAILIEHFAGAFPLWLSPEQVRVVPISDAQRDAAEAMMLSLRDAGIRATLDDRNETLNYRIRDGEMAKVPYLAVVGGREAESGSVAVRVRGAGNKQEVIALTEFTARLVEEVRMRSLGA